MSTVYIGLGSNLSHDGNTPTQLLEQAIEQLRTLAIDEVRVSSWYRTRPVGPQDQPDYINAVACFDTAMEPATLLAALNRIEHEQGRRRDGERWGARTLDLDILLYHGVEMSTDVLTIPHAQMHLREFVLRPLAELAPDVAVGQLGQATALLAALPEHGVVRL